MPARPDRGTRSDRGRAHCRAPAARRQWCRRSASAAMPDVRRGPAGSRHTSSTAMMVAPVKPPPSPARIFSGGFCASAARPSVQIATFTAHTKAIMVTMAAASAAHHGFGLKRRTRMETRIANGTATSAMRKSPGVPLIRSDQRRQQAASGCRSAGLRRRPAASPGLVVTGSDRLRSTPTPVFRRRQFWKRNRS